MEPTVADAMLFEQRFWLQIMGDHARFIFYSLAPNETGEIPRAQSFISIYDNLLARSRTQLNSAELADLVQQAYNATEELKSFKLQLLALTLSSKVKSSLSSTFFNHMLNELEEYQNVVNVLNSGQIPAFYPIHYHLLWLSDAVGHAAGAAAYLDEVEKDYIDSSREYEKQFTDLYIKSVNLNGYTRTKLTSFPSMDRLNFQASELMKTFRQFLEHLRDARKNGSILGTLMPITADHMAREECYYLLKLSQSAKNVTKTDCDPARQRVE